MNITGDLQKFSYSSSSSRFLHNSHILKETDRVKLRGRDNRKELGSIKKKDGFSQEVLESGT